MESVIYAIMSEVQVESIRKITYENRITNALKTNELIEFMETVVGAEHIGSGTNRIVFTHEAFPSIVIKIAIDTMGVDDNDAEFKLTDEYWDILGPYIAETYENNGIISIQERADMIGTEPFGGVEAFKKFGIFDKFMEPTLEKLMTEFVLDDVGKTKMQNWGWIVEDDNLTPIMIDFAYLYPTSEANLKCTRRNPDTEQPCGGDIWYNNKMTKFVCSECGAEKTFSKARLTPEQIASQASFNDETL